jgi:hypothetical protein
VLLSASIDFLPISRCRINFIFARHGWTAGSDSWAAPGGDPTTTLPGVNHRTEGPYENAADQIAHSMAPAGTKAQC